MTCVNFVQCAKDACPSFVNALEKEIPVNATHAWNAPSSITSRGSGNDVTDDNAGDGDDEGPNETNLTQ